MKNYKYIVRKCDDELVKKKRDYMQNATKKCITASCIHTNNITYQFLIGSSFIYKILKKKTLTYIYKEKLLSDYHTRKPISRTFWPIIKRNLNNVPQTLYQHSNNIRNC